MPATGLALRVGYGVPKARNGSFQHADLLQSLREFNGSFVLLGSAGSGKSHAIKHYLAECGKGLRDWGLAVAQGPRPTVAILLDARLYDGSFWRLYSTTVTAALAP